MTRYLLDTDALISYSKGRQPAVSRITQLIDQGDELGVCAVNVAEFFAGLAPGPPANATRAPRRAVRSHARHTPAAAAGRSLSTTPLMKSAARVTRASPASAVSTRCGRKALGRSSGWR